MHLVIIAVQGYTRPAQCGPSESHLIYEFKSIPPHFSNLFESKPIGQDGSTLRNDYQAALLEGQDASRAAASLHLDLSFFIKHLYRSLYTYAVNPEIEYNPNNSLRLPDPEPDRFI